VRIRTDLNNLASIAGGDLAGALDSEGPQVSVRGGIPGRAADVDAPTSIADSDLARPVEIEGRQGDRAGGTVGRAYRAGRLVCGCVLVTVGLDGRLGLTLKERRLMRVRFCEPIEDELRAELTQLVRRRGTAALRAAERVDPIEVVVDDPHGDRLRAIGRLQPPQVRHGLLRDVEFGLCDLARSR
jgi:hypothetical protein